MRQLSQGWKPRVSRRSRDRALRVAAAALIAAAVAEYSEAAPPVTHASSSWSPGNPAVLGTYFGDTALDLDGDGITDFILHANGYGGPLTLEPLTVGSVNNQIFQDLPPASGNGIVPPVLVRSFANPDDILSAGGPMITVPSLGLLSNFSTEGYAGVIFHIPPPAAPGTRAASLGGDDFGYLQITTVFPGVRITAVGIQPVGTSGVGDSDDPKVVFLASPRPNPARGAATLRFGLPREAEVSLGVYDLSGRLVRELAGTRLTAGEHTLTWDLRDGAGTRVSGGLFFVRLNAGGIVRVGRLAVIG